MDIIYLKFITNVTNYESIVKTPFNREERKEREGNSKMF
jgi:hypothetical protein